MKFNIKKKFASPVLILVLGMILHFLFVFNVERERALKGMDATLLRAAKNIKFYMGRDYVNSGLHSDTYSQKEILKKNQELRLRAKGQGVDYLYLLIKDGEDIRYVALSCTQEELIKDPKAFYWHSFSESGDDSFDETWRAFEERGPVYLESSDVWDTYRSVYVLERAPDGTEYLAGADITITHFKKILLMRTAKTISSFWIFVLFSLPLILSFSKLKKEKKVYKKQVTELSSLDPLTGTYNRNTGVEYLKTELKACTTEEVPLSVCIVDTQNLGYINKRHGLDTGDEVLKMVAVLMTNIFRKTDKVVRLEGDKFMAILPGCNENSRTLLAKALLDRLSSFNRYNRKDHLIKLHYIFREYSEGSGEKFIEETLSHLLLQKSHGTAYDMMIQEEMLNGLKNNEFDVFFQPKVHLDEETLEFEALIRWMHPEKGIISPVLFIPQAEKSFLISRLTEVVLRRSLRAAERLGTNISVNISPVVFENHNFIREMEKILSDSPCSRLITFEITESVAIKDMKTTLRKMKSLQKYGVRFSIDDFGTGYSSLGYLEKLPIGELKIDKTFIQNIDKHKLNHEIISFICKVGRLMNFTVIAEGTEEEWQIRELIALGCHSFQGYFFDKPQPLEVITARREDYMKKIKKFAK